MKCIREVLVEDDIRIRLGQYCFQSLKLGLEARGIIRRIFPVQSKLDADLGDLDGDADDAHYAEWIHHGITMKKIDSVHMNDRKRQKGKVEILQWGQ